MKKIIFVIGFLKLVSIYLYIVLYSLFSVHYYALYLT